MADIVLGIAVTTLISMYGSFITAPNGIALVFFSEDVLKYLEATFVSHPFLFIFEFSKSLSFKN